MNFSPVFTHNCLQSKIPCPCSFPPPSPPRKKKPKRNVQKSQPFPSSPPRLVACRVAASLLKSELVSGLIPHSLSRVASLPLFFYPSEGGGRREDAGEDKETSSSFLFALVCPGLLTRGRRGRRRQGVYLPCNPRTSKP